MKTRVAVASGLAAALALLGFSTSVRGSISGFGDNGAGWTLNSTTANKPVIVADHLLITQNGEFSVAKSAWCNTSQSISGEWVARFTVRRSAPLSGTYADGCAFVIQANGLKALGGCGVPLG